MESSAANIQWKNLSLIRNDPKKITLGNVSLNDKLVPMIPVKHFCTKQDMFW